MNIFKIYTANYESEGYKQGFYKGKNNLPKHHFGALKAIHPINYMYQFHTAMKSYSDAFDTGYTDGQRKREQLFNMSSHQSTNRGQIMSEYNYNSAIIQLAAQIQEIERNIKQLDLYLEQYFEQINKMSSAGFLDDYTNKLREMYVSLEKEKDSLKEVLYRLLEKFTLAKDALSRTKSRI